MTKTHFKEWIPDIAYITIFYVLNMMEPHANTTKINAVIKNCGKKLKHQRNAKVARKSKLTLEYIETTEPGYYWHGYITVGYLTEMSEDEFIWLIKYTTTNRWQGEQLIGILQKNRVNKAIGLTSMIRVSPTRTLQRAKLFYPNPRYTQKMIHYNVSSQEPKILWVEEKEGR